MADFCKQCSLVMFGSDFRELADPQLKPGYANGNLCEGCGYIQTNAAGECISSDCLCAGHHVPHKWLDELQAEEPSGQ